MKIVFAGEKAVNSQDLSNVLLAVAFTVDCLETYQKDGTDVIYVGDPVSKDALARIIDKIDSLDHPENADKYVLFQCLFGRVRSMNLAYAIHSYLKSKNIDSSDNQDINPYRWYTVDGLVKEVMMVSSECSDDNSHILDKIKYIKSLK